MTYKYTTLSFAMILLAGLAIWLTFISMQTDKKSLPVGISQPDVLMEDVTALIFDKQGKPKLKIVTPKLMHFVKEDRAQLTSPQLTLYRNSPTPWHISANKANTMHGLEQIDFIENVMIHHAADHASPATVIQTNSLTVYPDKQLAETPEKITMKQPSLVVKAQGMQANMTTGDIRLLAEARGFYEPNS